jgi:hypothetical protein
VTPNSPEYGKEAVQSLFSAPSGKSKLPVLGYKQTGRFSEHSRPEDLGRYLKAGSLTSSLIH